MVIITRIIKLKDLALLHVIMRSKEVLPGILPTYEEKREHRVETFADALVKDGLYPNNKAAVHVIKLQFISQPGNSNYSSFVAPGGVVYVGKSTTRVGGELART